MGRGCGDDGMSNMTRSVCSVGDCMTRSVLFIICCHFIMSEAFRTELRFVQTSVDGVFWNGLVEDEVSDVSRVELRNRKC